MRELAASSRSLKRIGSRDEVELTLYRLQRDEVIVKADILIAVISQYRAILYQKELKSFTAKDVSLRKWIFDMYDKLTHMPFLWGGDSEPKYEVEEEKT